MSFKARHRRPLTLPSPPWGEGFRARALGVLLALPLALGPAHGGTHRLPPAAPLQGGGVPGAGELFRAHADDLAGAAREAACRPRGGCGVGRGRRRGALSREGRAAPGPLARRRGAAVARGAAQRGAGNAHAVRGPADGVPVGAARRLPPRRLRPGRRRRPPDHLREAAARRRQHRCARRADEDRHRRGGGGRGLRGPRAAPCRSRPRRHAGDPRRQILPRQGLGARRGRPARRRLGDRRGDAAGRRAASLARPGGGRRLFRRRQARDRPRAHAPRPGRAAAVGLRGREAVASRTRRPATRTTSSARARSTTPPRSTSTATAGPSSSSRRRTGNRSPSCRCRDGIRELRRIGLPAPAGRGLAALGAGKDAHIIAALEDGRVVVIRP